MMTNSSPITRFELLGLYGDRDITATFTSPIKILVDENGSGKTTVLNTLFNILSGHWERLAELEFEEIRIHFPNDKSVDIDPTIFGLDSHDAEQSSYPPNHLLLLRELEKVFSIEELGELVDEMMNFSNMQRITRLKELYLALSLPFPDPHKRRYPSEKTAMRQAKIKRHQLSKCLQKWFPYSVLHFPTYRRVEEDLHSLGHIKVNINRDEQLIHFGMRDVKRRFERITDDIRDSSVEWYSIINGRMLTQLIEGPKLDDSALKSLNNPQALRIVLDRVGENIDGSDKERLLRLVNSGDIKQPEYRTLAYFLSNLLQVYERQQDKDLAIKGFVRVANGYLEDKEVRYNESKVDLQIINKRTGKKVPLERLSSGEKQIISIFSRLYLEESSPVAILFDEPELSLSMEWQKKLLQDIVDSGKCAFLLAATHSPFIFDNDLDQFASVLDINYREAEGESS